MLEEYFARDSMVQEAWAEKVDEPFIGQDNPDPREMAEHRAAVAKEYEQHRIDLRREFNAMTAPDGQTNLLDRHYKAELEFVKAKKECGAKSGYSPLYRSEGYMTEQEILMWSRISEEFIDPSYAKTTRGKIKAYQNRDKFDQQASNEARVMEIVEKMKRER